MIFRGRSDIILEKRSGVVAEPRNKCHMGDPKKRKGKMMNQRSVKSSRCVTMICMVVLVCLCAAYGGEGPGNVKGSLPDKVYQKLTTVFPTAQWRVDAERAAAHGLTEYVIGMKIGKLELKVTMDSTGKIVSTRKVCPGESGGKAKNIFAGREKAGVKWKGTTWYLESDPQRLFVNTDGDLEWTPKGRERFVTNIATQCLSHVGDVVEKSYMFMSDGDNDCEDCLKCPDSCFDADITCLAGTSDIRVGLFQSVATKPGSDGYRGFKGYNFRFGPNMMAGPTRWVDCTDEVHKTGMFGKKPVNRGDLMSRNSGLMGRIPGFDLKPGKYSYFKVKLERIAANSVRLSITLNDRTITYVDDEAEDQPGKIDVFAVSMRNKRPFTRLVLRSLDKKKASAKSHK